MSKKALVFWQRLGSVALHEGPFGDQPAGAHLVRGLEGTADKGIHCLAANYKRM